MVCMQAGLLRVDCKQTTEYFDSCLQIFSCFSFFITGRNEPLKKDRPKWKSDYPMTEGQLRSKRDEFWDTAPAFEGRKEIWDALKAATVALECNDHELAQAIVDGASITLPHGEDGNRLIHVSSLCHLCGTAGTKQENPRVAVFSGATLDWLLAVPLPFSRYSHRMLR